METMVKKENRQEAISLADTIQKMSIPEQRVLAAFVAGVQYGTVAQQNPEKRKNISKKEEMTEAV